MNKVIKILRESKLQQQEFVQFLGLTKSQFDYAMRKSDPIYIRGLESKLRDFIRLKIGQLKKIKF